MSSSDFSYSLSEFLIVHSRLASNVHQYVSQADSQKTIRAQAVDSRAVASGDFASVGCRLGTACAAIGTLDKDDERVYAPSSAAIFARLGICCDTFRSHSRWTNTISGGRNESVSRREADVRRRLRAESTRKALGFMLSWGTYNRDAHFYGDAD
jgi:hypothetical protein